MADWTKPVVADPYVDYTSGFSARDVDIACGFDPAVVTVTNPPTNAIRWNSVNKYWEKLGGASWANNEPTGGYAVNISGKAAKLAGGAAGSLPYQSAADTTAMLAASTNGYILTLVAGVPAWVANPAIFPTGTRKPFNQTAAPTGWTKDTTAALNDTAMRIVTGAVGSGGSVAFSSASYTPTISGSTAGYALQIADIPAHSHTANVTGGTSVNWYFGASYQNMGSGQTSSTGGGGAHSHGAGTLAASAVTLALKYNDFIIGVKN